MMQFVTRGVKPDEPKPAYEPPPEPARVWGPIDGGKNYGWIDASVEDDPNAEEKRIAPPKPQATMAFAADAVRAAEAEAEAAKARGEGGGGGARGQGERGGRDEQGRAAISRRRGRRRTVSEYIPRRIPYPLRAAREERTSILYVTPGTGTRTRRAS